MYPLRWQRQPTTKSERKGEEGEREDERGVQTAATSFLTVPVRAVHPCARCCFLLCPLSRGIAELLTLAFGRDDFIECYPQFTHFRDHIYILIVNVDHEAPQVVWPGEVIHVETSIEATITSMELEVGSCDMASHNIM